jgi:carbamoyltransferase
LRVLGIWDGHDSGAALLVDGRIVAAINEERLSRRKLEVRFPVASIAACLDLGRLRPQDIDIVSASTSDIAKTIARLFPSTKEAYYQVRRRKAPGGPGSTLRKRTKYWITELGASPLSRALSRACLRRSLRRIGLGAADLQLYDHHHCHAVTAACASGFHRAVVVTLDGVGDGLSASVSTLAGGALELIARTPARHSPGIFFEHVTNLLNMRELEDEGKVMALAGFAARPDRNPLATLLQAQGLRFSTALPGHALYGRLRRLQWSFPNEQFARMAQETLEVAVVDVVRAAVRETGIAHVALAGGVASNIQINRLIRLLPEVEEVFVFPHMGDGGLALGAALASAHAVDRNMTVSLGDIALGPGYSDEEIQRTLDASHQSYQRPVDLPSTVANLLLADRVVLWFQGRMEYGPRALGQRSILARADKVALRDRLNLVLKRRVWYQPFCPSILESDARRVFSDWKGRPDRYMTMAYQVDSRAQNALAAVINVDGTCRPQIVPDDCNSDFAAVLRAMQARAGCGVVLNTSLNRHGDPLVCSPEEALELFKVSAADALVVGPFLITAVAQS